ncbi:MAG: hypothetical protein HFF17_15580 [Oscillospiraceae bacterium]|nr:hypothetical protein [Oscillospiraceae bacterium]
MAFVYVDYPQDFRELLEKILNPAFMQEFTRFQSFEGFRYSSAVFVNWEGEQLVYNEEVFDNFVKESTRFSSWDEMVRTATDRYFQSGGQAPKQ